jgi:hypothetical protein
MREKLPVLALAAVYSCLGPNRLHARRMPSWNPTRRQPDDKQNQRTAYQSIRGIVADEPDYGRKSIGLQVGSHCLPSSKS